MQPVLTKGKEVGKGGGVSPRPDLRHRSSQQETIVEGIELFRLWQLIGGTHLQHTSNEL